MHFFPRDGLFRLVVVNLLAGAILGMAFAALLIAFDVQGLRSLLVKTDAVVPALLLLFGGFAVTFGSAVCGSAIMTLGGYGLDDGPSAEPGRLG